MSFENQPRATLLQQYAREQIAGTRRRMAQGKQVQDLEDQVRHLERENLKLCFLNKQSAAQIRKLERDFVSQRRELASKKWCGACTCLDKYRRSRSSSQLAPGRTSVKRARSEQNVVLQTRNGDNDDDVDLMDVEFNNDDVDVNEATTSSASAAANQQTDVSQQKIATLQRKLRLAESECSRLRDENRKLEESATTRDMTSQISHKIDNVERELQRLQREKRSTERDNEELRLLVSTGETNLLRCEQQVKTLAADRKRLKEQIAYMKQQLQGGDLSQQQSNVPNDPIAHRHRSRSATRHQQRTFVHSVENSSSQQTRSRSRSPSATATRAFNPYCRVCSEYGPELQALARGGVQNMINAIDNQAQQQDVVRPPLATVVPSISPDSGFGGEKVSAAADRSMSKLSQENQRLTNKIVKLTNDNKLLKKECDNVNDLYLNSRKENTDLQRQLFDMRLSMATNNTGMNDDGTSTAKQLDAARTQIKLQELKQAAELEKSRFVTNERLLNAKNTKLEQDKADVERQLADLRTQVATANRQIAEFNKTKTRGESRTTETHTTIIRMQQEHGNIQRLYDTTKQLLDLERRETERLRQLVAAQQLQQQNRETSAVLEQSGTQSTGSAAGVATNVAVLQEQLRTKDREVTRLREMVTELGTEYNRFRSSLTHQEETLHKLQTDLSNTSDQKQAVEQELGKLSTQNASLLKRISDLTEENTNLRQELARAVEEQDSLKRTAQRHLDEIQTYERLMKEKEEERQRLRADLQRLESQAPLLRGASALPGDGDDDAQLTAMLQQANDELLTLKCERDKWSRDHNTLRRQLERCEHSLQQLRQSHEIEREQKKSLHDDLVKARQIILRKDEDLTSAMRRIAQLEADIDALRH